MRRHRFLFSNLSPSYRVVPDEGEETIMKEVRRKLIDALVALSFAWEHCIKTLGFGRDAAS